MRTLAAFLSSKKQNSWTKTEKGLLTVLCFLATVPMGCDPLRVEPKECEE